MKARTLFYSNSIGKYKQDTTAKIVKSHRRTCARKGRRFSCIYTALSVTFVVAVGFSCPYVRAQEIEAELKTQELQAVVGKLQPISVNSLRRVAIGDPEIADINVLSSDEILLVPKSAGHTVLIIWDKQGQRSVDVKVTTADILKQAEQIKRVLKSLQVPGMEIKVEGDKIFVLGQVSRESDLESIAKAVSSFETATNLVRLSETKPLVQINVNVLELGRDDLSTLGADWSDSVLFTERAPATSTFWKLWKLEGWDRASLTANFKALIEEGKSRSLANPSIVTVSGKEANILVGGEIPIVLVETDERTKVEWKPYGVVLKIKPTIINKEEINTVLKAEVSDLDWANAVTYQGINVPAMKKRTAETELYLKDGDTLIIGGLIKKEDSKNVDKLPYLSDVPVLGSLFKSAQFQAGDTELVLAVTPKILGEKASWPEKEGLRGLSEMEEKGAQSKLEALKKLEDQMRRQEKEARAKKKEMDFLQDLEKEKVRKFEEIIAVLGQEKASTQRKLEELKSEQGFIKQQEQKIKENKEKLAAYLQAEQVRLKMVEKIKRLREEIEELMKEPPEQRPDMLPEELPEEKWQQDWSQELTPEQQEKQQAMEEELARLQALKKELLEAKTLEKTQAPQGQSQKQDQAPLWPAQENQKKEEVIKALREIEEVAGGD